MPPAAARLLAPEHVRAVLIAAGVQLVADDATTIVAGPTGDVPLVLPDTSIERLSGQASNSTGLLGSTLDGLGGGVPSALPPSALLVAYARAADTDGAAIARAALGAQDLTRPAEVVFPALVQLLFAADAVHEIGGPEAFSGPRSAAVTLAAFKPCSAFTKLVYGTVNKVFDALHIPAGRVGATGSKFLDAILQGLTDVVIAGLNIIIEAGRTLVINAVRFLLSDVISLIAEVSSIVALVGTVLANIDPISLLAAPAQDQITRGTAPVTDVVTLSAHVLGPDEWPAWLDDCAFVSTGEHLPPLKPVGSPVTWTIVAAPAGLAARSVTATSDDELRDVPGRDAEARLVLETGAESPEVAAGPPRIGLVKVTAAVHRTGLDKVQAALIGLAKGAAATLTSKLPPVFRGYVERLLTGAAESATKGFTTLLDTKTWTFVTVVYHEKPSPTPGPTRPSLPTPPPLRRTPPPRLSTPPPGPRSSFGTPELCDEILKRLNDFLGTPSMDDEAIQRCLDQMFEQMLD